MAKLTKGKVKAATLIEVLIAMVIIMVVFAIAIRIFGNVLNSGVSLKKIQVQQQLNVLGMEVKRKGYVKNAHVQLDSVDYDFVTTTSDRVTISSLEIKASQHGKIVGKFNCLFKIKEVYDED